MDTKKKSKYIGALGALLVHVAIIALLILVSFVIPHPDEEAGGIPIMMGDVDMSQGNADPSLVDVEILPEQVPEAVQPVEPELPSEPPQEMITQTEEETVVVPSKPETKKETPKKNEAKKPEVKKEEVVKEQPKEVKKPEKTAAEKAAEAKRLAEEKAERERKAAAEAANKRVAGAFGKGSQMDGNKGNSTTGQGIEGSAGGNSSGGAKTGNAGYGTFDLGGRSIGEGGLPRPVYNVQEEGRVVVTITVNPEGSVIATSINRLTNTVSSVLRRAAEDAAKKARFNAVDGMNNQTGTITYYFNLK